MKVFITAATVLLILNGVNGCLRVHGSFTAGCVGGQGRLRLIDNGVTTCDGDCNNYRDCTPNCIEGYSARVQYGYTHLTYSNPHNTFTQDLTPNEKFFCCFYNAYGGCNANGFSTSLDGSFFGC